MIYQNEKLSVTMYLQCVVWQSVYYSVKSMLKLCTLEKIFLKCGIVTTKEHG